MKSNMTMVLTNKQGKTRESTIRSISADDNRQQIIWFLSPADDKGVAFLKIEHTDKDDEMRLWLPAFKKVRRISSKKKADSFMGSDLSYEDMTSRELDEYTYELKGEKTVDGIDCHILESIPKEGVTRTYKRFVTYVSKADLVGILDEAYDMRDQLLKRRVMKYTKQKSYDLPLEIYVENVQKQHSTRLKFTNIEVDTGVEEDLFQEKNLKRMPR
ncbi:outer membrane lipoprotein-sorting protein [bacterium]|nr:outer membrane lipoprotein-sorting protein [bacterium]